MLEVEERMCYSGSLSLIDRNFDKLRGKEVFIMPNEEIPLKNDNLVTYREFLKKRVERGIIKIFGSLIEEGIDKFVSFIVNLLNWEKEKEK